MYKTAFIDTILAQAAHYIPALAGHIPASEHLGLGMTAGKYLVQGAAKGVKALREGADLSRRFGTNIVDGMKLRGTPRANLVLGKGSVNPPSKLRKLYDKVDTGSDVASTIYNVASLAKNII